ncbi:hypothetical protein D3C81_2320930 [compost metagenome]
MGEGTVGGFFEFFVFEGSLEICVWGIGSNFEHSESPRSEFQLRHSVPSEGVAAVRRLEPGGGKPGRH